MKKIVPFIFICMLCLSCGPANKITRESQYAAMYENMPRTLLVMPPINRTTNVEAKDLLYTSVSTPLIESGYYVISPHLAMDILKAESAYDAELFIEQPLTQFKEYFGADAVVFSQIDTWTKRGLGIDTKIRYIIKSTTTNEVLFDRSCDLYLSFYQNNGSNNLLGMVVNLAAAAIETAASDHIEAARLANYYIFSDIPRGVYSPDHMQDKEVIAQAKDIKATVRQ